MSIGIALWRLGRVSRPAPHPGSGVNKFILHIQQQVIPANIRCIYCMLSEPPCAMITVYRMEKESIYVDPYYLSSPVRYLYVRYVDDSGSLAYSREEAIRNCKMISDMDTDGRILWEVEYPDNEDEYVAFLDTEN